jgi:hypothetical protein
LGHERVRAEGFRLLRHPPARVVDPGRGVTVCKDERRKPLLQNRHSNCV